MDIFLVLPPGGVLFSNEGILREVSFGRGCRDVFLQKVDQAEPVLPLRGTRDAWPPSGFIGKAIKFVTCAVDVSVCK